MKMNQLKVPGIHNIYVALVLFLYTVRYCDVDLTVTSVLKMIFCITCIAYYPLSNIENIFDLVLGEYSLC